MACKEVFGVNNISEVNGSLLSQEQIVEYLSCLSTTSFQSRMPVVVYLSVITIVGCLGNALVLVVYWTDTNLSANRTFIMVMAIHDLATSVLGLPLQILTIRYAYDTFSLSFCRTMFALATLPTQSSGVILVAVSLDRFHRIWWPYKHHLSAQKATKVSVILTAVICVIFGAFIPMYGIHTLPSHVPGLKVYMCWSYDRYNATQYGSAYSYVVEVLFFGSCIPMVGSYLMIAFKLWRSKPFNSKATARKLSFEEETKSTSVVCVSSINSPHEQHDLVTNFASLPMPNVSNGRHFTRSSPVSGNVRSLQSVPPSKAANRVDKQVDLRLSPTPTISKDGKIKGSNLSPESEPDNIESRSAMTTSPSQDPMEKPVTMGSDSPDHFSYHSCISGSASPSDHNAYDSFPVQSENMELSRTESLYDYVIGFSGSNEIDSPRMPENGDQAKIVNFTEGSPEEAPTALYCIAEDQPEQRGKPDFSKPECLKMSELLEENRKDEVLLSNVNTEIHLKQNHLNPSPEKQHTLPKPGLRFTTIVTKADNVGKLATTWMKKAKNIDTPQEIRRKKFTKHTTRMMAVLTVCYIVNWMPHYIVRTHRSDPVNICEQFVNCGYNVYALALRSYYLNSAVNVFVYSFMCESFRKTCAWLFRKYWSKFTNMCRL